MDIRGNESPVLVVNADVQDASQTKINYASYSRPGMAEKLSSMRLDAVFTSAQGNYLVHQVNQQDVSVLDALGGFGANIFGHHNPQLVNVIRDNLDAKLPFMSQMSVRPKVALLSARLNDLLSARTDDAWVSIVLTTGADAVEAALKHAEMCRVKRLNAFLLNVRKQLNRCRKGLVEQRLSFNSDFLTQLNTLLGVSVDKLDSQHVFDMLNKKIELLAEQRPTSLALKRSYHGKSNGALHLTAGERYRSYFVGLAHETNFVDPLDTGSLQSEIDNATLNFPSCTVIDNEIHLVQQLFVNISALFAEPLQGEGGVHPVQKRFLQHCRALSLQHKFHFVLDEIQSGMGRTGTFLYSEQLGITADCYLLSKSLGGGLSKVSAACFAKRLYDPEFDEIHSSTFAEDDHSAAVALKALDMVTRQPDLMKKAKKRGAYLKRELQAVQQRYPGIIADVRGQGLFIGVEFLSRVDSEFFVLRALSQHSLLGYMLVGYLLHEHRVRVATTMSDNFVLRIEPSFFITRQECDRIIRAIESAAEVIYNGDMFQFTRFLVGLERSHGGDQDTTVESYIGRGKGVLNSPDPDCPTVTFASNIIKPVHLVQLEPSLSRFTQAQLQQLCTDVLPAIGPTTILLETVTSNTGEKVNFTIEMIMYDPHYLIQAMRSNGLQQVNHDLKTVLNTSVEGGSSVLGLGAYTSIVSHNGLRLNSDDISITTGNALTVGMGVRTMLQAASDMNIDVSTATLGVVGAGGNIGSVYAQILAEHLPAMILVGRPNGLQKLHKVAADVYCNAVLDRADAGISNKGVAAIIRSTQAFASLGEFDLDSVVGKRQFYQTVNAELGTDAPIKVVDDMVELAASNLILCASNSAEPILHAQHMGEQAVVVCDVSVPEDVSPEVHDCPNVRVISGGIVELPRDPKLRWLGIDNLGEGSSYACMAETMLLGLEGHRSHGSYGPISKAQVHDMLELADKHGFGLARTKSGESVF